MKKINLNITPNQIFTVTIEGVNYQLTTRLTRGGIILMSVSADGIALCNGVRCMPNRVVIPYDYLTNGGNFYWACDDDEYPDYLKFNDQHKLLYYTDTELLDVV